MTHIEEDILELYVLDSAEVGEMRAEIDRHLAECPGCRRRVEEMRAYYSELEERLEAAANEEGPVRRDVDLASRRGYSRPVYVDRRAPLARLRDFVFMHPVATGVGSVAFMGGLIFVLSLTTRPAPGNLNPAFVRYNQTEMTLDVYGGKNTRLWSVPATGIDIVKEGEDRTGFKGTVIADVDGDGWNEVITVARTPRRSPVSGAFVSAYSGEGELRWEVELGRPTAFRGRSYASNYAAVGVAAVKGGEGQVTIAVSVTGLRSPSLTVMLDGEGAVRGEYWHFGAVGGPFLYDVDRDGREELLIGGSNDLEDSTEGDFPVLVALDPSRMVGTCESSVTTGFGFERSRAEVYYIHLPKTETDSALHVKPGVVAIRKNSLPEGDALSVWVHGGHFIPEARVTQTEYVFSADLSPIEVRSSDYTLRSHLDLLARGAVRSRIDESYLQRLKSSILYWTGSGWTRERTRVSSPVAAN